MLKKFFVFCMASTMFAIIIGLVTSGEINGGLAVFIGGLAAQILLSSGEIGELQGSNKGIDKRLRMAESRISHLLNRVKQLESALYGSPDEDDSDTKW